MNPGDLEIVPGRSFDEQAGTLTRNPVQTGRPRHAKASPQGGAPIQWYS
jgi:hypothetical protein